MIPTDLGRGPIPNNDVPRAVWHPLAIPFTSTIRRRFIKVNAVYY